MAFRIVAECEDCGRLDWLPVNLNADWRTHERIIYLILRGGWRLVPMNPKDRASVEKLICGTCVGQSAGAGEDDK